MSLILWLALAFLAAALGGVASLDAAAFYDRLTLPAWAPAAAVFGPVWTVLYAAMGVSAWLVWRRRDTHRVTPALALFVVQLFCNVLWSWLFFAWRLGGVALLDIAVLWVLIAATGLAFWRIRRLAAVLLIPYLVWVSFAGALNYAIWSLNPSLL